MSPEEAEKCQAAFRGEAIPHDLLHRKQIRYSLVHAIRNSETFANSPEVIELCSRWAEYPEFARARHARLIMSNVIPEVSDPSLLPYCFWYPEVAREETYRRLAEQYPSLRYHVGRACAVAGYTSLYISLNLLPEVSIAEEARDNVQSGGDIYKDIMTSPVRYKVLDDYTRTTHIDEPQAGAHLNGDTCVRSSLDFRQSVEHFASSWQYLEDLNFDITEDSAIGETDSGTAYPTLRPDEVQLLYMPLPPDLPTVNKDLLILMAAHEGNVDRYARLHRPHLIKSEQYCIARGIYHNTSFAKWWEQELKSEAAAARLTGSGFWSIQTAITARFIMCNDLSRVTESQRSHQPYLIWYPLLPRELTLLELFSRVPDMKPQIAHACVVADYQKAYDSLDVVPTRALWLEAKSSPNRHYLEDLERRAAEREIDLEADNLFDRWKNASVTRDKEPTSSWLYSAVHAGLVEPEHDEGIYEGIDAHSCFIDLFLCSSEEMRNKASAYEAGLWFLYEE